MIKGYGTRLRYDRTRPGIDPHGPENLSIFATGRFEKWLTLITGTRFSSGHLQEIGARIFNLERIYNLREGLSEADDTLPDRILHEPTFDGMDSGHPLDQLLPSYYKKRGWDEHGVPQPKTLAKLGVSI